MKILHVIETLAVEGGGGDRACLELGAAQVALGHDVSVICFQDAGETALAADGVKTLRFNRSDRLGLREAISKACAGKTDIVHVHGAWRMLQVWACRICTRHGTSYVFQPHGLFSLERMLHKRLRKKTWFHLFERSNLRKAAFVVAESLRDRESLARLVAPEKIIEIPCGGGLSGVVAQPSLMARKYPELKNRPFLLFFGRLDFHKGIDILIDAYAAMPRLREVYELAIVGPDFNDTRRKLEFQVSQHGLSSVHFYGIVTEESEKAALFDAASAFVLPSRDENFGITVLEALSRDCPVLVSNATAWKSLEILGAGFVFDPEQRSLQTALQRFLEVSDQDRQRQIKNGRRLAAEYDWTHIAARSLDFYGRVLRG